MLRPVAFMELMTDKSLYPAVGTWNIWPKLMGDDRPIPWIAVRDLGEVAAIVLGDARRIIGKDLKLASDVETLAACRAIYEEVVGKSPPVFPIPMWLFDRFTRNDLTTMWRWCRTGDVPLDTELAHALHPSALTVRKWLEAGSRR